MDQRTARHVAVTILSILGFLAGGAVATATESLVCEQYLWGVHGEYARDAYNLLSVRLRNAAADPFRGVLRLQAPSASRFHIPVGHRAEIYVSPGASRWIQFYVRGYEPGALLELAAVGAAPWKHDIRVPTQATAATVVLVDESRAVQSPSLGAVLPVGLFPSSAAALESVELIVLDFLPTWTDGQRRALIDWVGAGGVLHAYEGEDGLWPALDEWFPGAALGVAESESRRNDLDPQRQMTYGRGAVAWIAQSLRRLPRDDAPTPIEVEEDGFGAPRPWGAGDDPELQALLRLARPQPMWAFIYLLGLLLVVSLALQHRLTRVSSGFLVSKLALAATLALFSLLFFVLARPSPSGARLEAAGYARSVGPGRYEVEHKLAVWWYFGGLRTIGDETVGSLCSVTQTHLSTATTLCHDRGSELQADLPINSVQTLQQTSYQEGAELVAGIAAYRASGVESWRLLQLDLDLAGEFEPIQAAWVRYQEALYSLVASGTPGRWSLGERVGGEPPRGSPLSLLGAQDRVVAEYREDRARFAERPEWRNTIDVYAYSESTVFLKHSEIPARRQRLLIRASASLPKEAK
ncbi:MAG: hypothetical protein AB7O52_07275 [Planctomycetota bacterium]